MLGKLGGGDALVHPNQTLYQLVRIFCKLYEFTLRIYTLLVRGFESDPSKILVDHYTEAQTRAQLIIDQNLNESTEIKGELLVIIPEAHTSSLGLRLWGHWGRNLEYDSEVVPTLQF